MIEDEKKSEIDNIVKKEIKEILKRMVREEGMKIVLIKNDIEID